MDQKTLNDLRSLLLECGELDSDQSLGSLFVVDELEPYVNTLPVSYSKSERVDNLISFLARNRFISGECLLPKFLVILKNRYRENQKIYADISNLLPSLENVISQKEKDLSLDTTQDSPHEEQLFHETASKFLNAIEKELRMNPKNYFPSGTSTVDINYWAIWYFPEQIQSSTLAVSMLNTLIVSLKQNKNMDIEMKNLRNNLRFINEQCIKNINLLDAALSVDSHHPLGRSAKYCLRDILNQIKIVQDEYVKVYGRGESLSKLTVEATKLRLLLTNLTEQFEKIYADIKRYI